jgi:hypothetical protein
MQIITSGRKGSHYNTSSNMFYKFRLDAAIYVTATVCVCKHTHDIPRNLIAKVSGTIKITQKTILNGGS